jgi:hypothetical protein
MPERKERHHHAREADRHKRCKAPSAAAVEVAMPQKTTSSMRPFEELHRALMLFGRFARAERTQISALTGLGVGFPGVETVVSGFEFPDHIR